MLTGPAEVAAVALARARRPATAIMRPAGRPRAASFRALPAATGALVTTVQPMTEGSLTKAALIKEVAHVAGLTRKCAEIIVDAVFGSIVETLHRGEKVELRGFGSFRLRRREPRRSRNPRTGDRVDVPSKCVAYFKPGKELGELINRAPAQPVAPRLPDQLPSNRSPPNPPAGLVGQLAVTRTTRSRSESVQDPGGRPEGEGGGRAAVRRRSVRRP